MIKPKSAAVAYKTALEDMEIIKKMAARYGDDKIALVLNRLGRRTGQGNKWNEFRVKYVRNTYHIPGHKRTVKNPEILTLQEAAKYCNVSPGTIRRLVEESVLKNTRRARGKVQTYCRCGRCSRTSFTMFSEKRRVRFCEHEGHR